MVPYTSVSAVDDGTVFIRLIVQWVGHSSKAMPKHEVLLENAVAELPIGYMPPNQLRNFTLRRSNV